MGTNFKRYKLKDCPFCGQQPLLDKASIYGGIASVECECGGEVSHWGDIKIDGRMSPEKRDAYMLVQADAITKEVIKKWNTRRKQ